MKTVNTSGVGEQTMEVEVRDDEEDGLDHKGLEYKAEVSALHVKAMSRIEKSIYLKSQPCSQQLGEEPQWPCDTYKPTEFGSEELGS